MKKIIADKVLMEEAWIISGLCYNSAMNVNKQSGIHRYAFSVIVAIMFLGGATFYMVYKGINNVSYDEATNPVNKWLSYTSSEYGFSFKYPTGYIIVKVNDSYNENDSNNGQIIISKSNSDTKSEVKYEFWLETTKYTDVVSYLKDSDQIKATGYEGQASVKVLDTRDILVNGTKAVQRTEQNLAGDFIYTAVYFKVGDNIMSFNTYPVDLQNYNQTFSDIVDSIKF
ncbi:MAG: hypothetical protein Q7R78_00115 [bacterium]|nr:hypothetical protein [bacterium]